MRSFILVISLAGAAVLPNPCTAQIFDNPFSQYVERGITITPGAGNAKDANAAIHTIDPWPPYAGYTRIPRDGRPAVDSVEQMYRGRDVFGGGQGQRQGQGGTGGMTGGGTSTGTGSTGQTMQPISSGN